MNFIKNIKGTSDFSPVEQRVRNYISTTLTEVFENYGYQPIETPILCYYDLLALKYEEDNDILKEVYKLTDQGNRDLGLRYDLTVPFAKYIALNKGLTLPLKKYEIGKVFRDGPVKVGRNREFIQCDVDVVGISDVVIDAELIALFVEACNRLKIDIVVKYNNRKLLSGIILQSGIDEDKITDAITIVDKMEKFSKEEITEQFIEKSISNECITNLYDYLNMDLVKLKELSSNELLNEGIEEIEQLNNYLDKMNLNDYVSFVPSLARGQSYYTGTVFEVYEKNYQVNSSIGGGGRYDNMITDFVNDGNKYPAVGISFGLNVIYELLKNREEFNNNNLDLFIIPMDTKAEALILANNLRKYNVKVNLEMNNRKMKKALEWANKNKIPNVIVLGETEVSNNEVEIKKMFGDTNYKVKLDDYEEIVKIIRK